MSAPGLRTAPHAETWRPSRRSLAVAGAVVVALSIVAYWRSGLLGLPRVPRDVTPETAGLAQLDAIRARARALDVAPPDANADAATSGGEAALALARAGLQKLQGGEAEAGVAALQRAVELAPDDLVLGNAYRMAVFRLRRGVLTSASERQTLAPQMPPFLAGQPIEFLTRLRQAHPGRETTLQLALAWVDEMLLYPALEIKAPASVESVTLLSEILQQNAVYVPALYGRGLNYLHRPARLVWPEAKKTAPDAASRDLGACVALGRKVGGASPRLVSTLALTLGDAYAKEGSAERARSWWQIAANASRDAEVRQAVQRRFAWGDAEMLDRLEEELQTRMLDLDHPLTDLEIMWR